MNAKLLASGVAAAAAIGATATCMAPVAMALTGQVGIPMQSIAQEPYAQAPASGSGNIGEDGSSDPGQTVDIPQIIDIEDLSPFSAGSHASSREVPVGSSTSESGSGGSYDSGREAPIGESPKSESDSNKSSSDTMYDWDHDYVVPEELLAKAGTALPDETKSSSAKDGADESASADDASASKS
jgi:hypothetical protein